MTDTTNLVLLAKLDIRGAINHKLLMADYFVPKALAVLIFHVNRSCSICKVHVLLRGFPFILIG
jgi:hypothetical protein